MSLLGKGIAAGLFAVSCLFCAAPGALAQESGTYRAVTTLTVDYTTIAHAEGAEVFGGSLQGVSVIVESSGGPWVEGARNRRTCVVFGRRLAEGVNLEAPCTLTDESGDQWFTVSKRTVGDVAVGGGGGGLIQLLGGRGKYAGITGSCSYNAGYLADDWLSTEMNCEWSRP